VIVFLLLIVVLLIGLTAAAVMGKIGGFLAEPTSSHAYAGVPSGSLSADDIGGLHFDQGLRGYRMDQVDDVIDALSARLRELETEVASLGSPEPPSPEQVSSEQVSPEPPSPEQVSSEQVSPEPL
jgi:DivIVA domain-containing protein